MKTVYKIIYFVSITLIILWFIKPLIFKIVGLEFIEDNIENRLRSMWIYILPISIFSTISVLGIKEKIQFEKWLHITMRLVFSLVFAVITLFISIAGDCGIYETTNLYHQVDSKNRISVRVSDCNPYPEQIVSIKPINKYLQIINDVDTLVIDRIIWRKQ